MLDKIKGALNQSPYLSILIGAAFMAAGFFVVYYSAVQDDFDWQLSPINQVGSRSYRLLDGVFAAEENSALKPIATVIENHIESRPVVGLEYASIIYETVVESGITRFLAVFDGGVSAKQIGPIRSARPFFVDLAEEWNPVYFHAGGSRSALDQLKKSPMFNIDEISGDGIYFWRDKNRYAPHNLFTSFDLINRALSAKKIAAEADFSPWLFKNDSPAGAIELIEEVEIDFLGYDAYKVRYKYNKKNNDYTRYLGGDVHKTDRGIILKARNIVVQYVDSRIIDSYGRLAIDLSGDGEAEIYQDGRAIKGHWEKIDGRTRFYEAAGEEIKFNRGTIWVELAFN